jgi:hypothetical protein
MLMQLSGALPTFAHKPRLMDYFVLAFGVMVWHSVAGHYGQYVYGELVKPIPEAAGEAAYVARASFRQR